MCRLISANDLHEAAEDPLMLPTHEGTPVTAREAVEALGMEGEAVRDFLQSTNFRWPYADGMPDYLEPRSVAYGICLGLVAAKRASASERGIG